MHRATDDQPRFTLQIGEPYYNILIAVTVVTNSAIGCMLIVSAYNTIPVSKINPLFLQISSSLVKYPNFVHRAAIVKSIIFSAIMVGVVVILPLQMETSYRDLPQIIVVVYLVSTLIFLFAHKFMLFNITKLFRQYVEMLTIREKEQSERSMVSTSSETESQIAAFRAVLSTVKKFSLVTILLFCFTVVVGCFIVALKGQYQFLLFQFFWLHLRIAEISVPIVIYYQTVRMKQ